MFALEVCTASWRAGVEMVGHGVTAVTAAMAAATAGGLAVALLVGAVGGRERPCSGIPLSLAR